MATHSWPLESVWITSSRSLRNEDPKVRPDLTARVQYAVAALGYRHNTTASAAC